MNSKIGIVFIDLLSFFQGMLGEASDQRPMFEALTSDVTTLCHHCSKEEEKVLVANHEQLAATYENIQTLAKARIELCKEWMRYMIAHKGCIAQIKALQQRLDSRELSQEELDKIAAEMEEAKAGLSTWDERRRELDQLMIGGQMVIKDRASRRILHFQSEIQTALSICDKARNQLQQKQGKLDEISQKWNEFEDMKRSLVGSLGNINQRLDACRPQVPSHQGLKDMTKEVKTMEKELKGHTGDLDKLRDLGRHLMAADSTNMSRAQDGLSEVDTEWERVQGGINDKLQAAIALSNLWNQYTSCNVSVRRALDNVQPLLEEDKNFSSQNEVKQMLERYKVCVIREISHF